MSVAGKSATLLLRPMQNEDVSGVMLVEHLNYPYPWTAGIMRDCLRARYSCWVYELAERIIGYGVLSVGAGEAHILNISIHPDFQGQGLGRELLQHLLERARSHGADTVFLEVRPSNKTAVQLYDSTGFNQAGLRRNYYPAEQGREDALIMALTL
ncbi:MAG: ribosomal protein S18-alanine N-acetyltransferase [Thiohalomonadaceae bacterium]|jgi:ribosomal-protein-alanine N-acetyltransferase